MKDTVLLELATRWENDAKPPEVQDGADEAKIRNAIDKGHRECKRECADTLRTLVKILGV
jgi:hypothetical protein